MPTIHSGQNFKMKTLVISPTYNEKKNIESLVEQILGANPDYHLLVIDDNSPDETANRVKELQNDYTNLEKQYNGLIKLAEKSEAPVLIHNDLEMTSSVLRDLISDKV